MNLDDFPLWAAIVIAVLVLAGALLTLLGTVGLVRFRTYYERIHAPTLGTSFGTLFMVIGSMLFFSLQQSRPVVHEILIFIFITVTTPVTLMLLARAALFRDQAEGKEVPGAQKLNEAMQRGED
ncbi:monovalent cation/H(+) antiporter subunit G [Paradevosia shaoguanensis]|uniref:Monovalent cation/H(+) antiporter subunit G n=1 Tax=Paradevosia shaoguanensis TaxID=1335043 RepID=A0AA41QLH8_9HYPH|nr:monovalent cation/H(+) antiporter subunit G [Paradevosia shaoguanensis]MCF1741895.1 monovalent cation/H(+) antiporter subunit G [Paradevosia shaoguanensis]MCI0126378.1 monovalent cation/H(+) antiporter subunit G [Paradevosia shaoguanensis]